MANLPDKSAPDLSQYLPARKSLVEEKLVELAKTEMPTVGQLLGLILEEDRSLLKLAQSDTTDKITLFSTDAERIISQIATADVEFRAQIVKPDIASEKILAATSAYRDSLSQLEAQRLKISGALENLGSQAQQLRNAKTHSGKLESGLNAVIEKVGDRPIPATILAALFSFSQEKPPAVVEQTSLPTVDLDQIALQATTQMASLHTRKDDHLLAENITVSVKSARPVGRPKLSNTPTVVHFKVSDILKDEGINLSELDSTNAQGITMSLKALLRDDVGIEDPTLDDMEKALRGIVRGDYRELLDNRRTLLTLDGLAKPRSAPAKIEEIKLKETQAEEVVITATPTAQPQRAFATPEPAGKRTMLDLAIVTDALTFDSHGRWKTGDLVSFSELTTDQRLSKEQGRAGNKRKDRQEVFAEVQTDFSKTADRVVRIADKVGAQTIGQLLNNKALEIPETQRQKLLPFSAVPVDQLPKVLDAIKMRGGQTNVLKPVNRQTLLDFLLPKDTKDE